MMFKMFKGNNPFDVLSENFAKRIIGHNNINKIEPSFDCKIDKYAQQALNSVYSTIFSQLTGVKTWPLGLYSTIEQKRVEASICRLLREQINYLRFHPLEIKEQLNICLVISTTYYYHAAQVEKNASRFSDFTDLVLTAVKKFSINEAIFEQVKKRTIKLTNQRWYVLRTPLALILSLLKEKTISDNQAVVIVRDLLYWCKHTEDVKDLMCTYYSKLMNNRIIDTLQTSSLFFQSLDVLKSEIPELKTYIEWYNDTKIEIIDDVPSVISVIGMFDSGKSCLLRNWGASIVNGKYNRFRCDIDGFGVEVSNGIDYVGGNHLDDSGLLNNLFEKSDYVVFIFDTDKFIFDDKYKTVVLSLLFNIKELTTKYTPFLYIIGSHDDKHVNKDIVKSQISNHIDSKGCFEMNNTYGFDTYCLTSEKDCKALMKKMLRL